MDANLEEFDHEPRVRPTLLTVLCILTFIGSGWAIVSSIWGYTTAAHNARMFSSSGVTQMADSTAQNDSVMRKRNHNRSAFGQKIMISMSKIMTEDSLRKSAIGAIIAALCTFIGALLMWRLRRIGFYLYIAGIIIGIIVPFYLYGNNMLAIGISSFSTFFGLVFIALYALNIKMLR